MRIAQVCPRYPPYIGGVEYVVKSVAEELAKIGQKVTVYTLDPTGRLPRRETLNRVEIRRYKGLSPDEAYHIPSMRLLQDLFKHRVDLVHVHNIHALIGLAVYIVKRLKKPWKMVVTPYYHGSGHSKLRKLLWGPYRPLALKVIKAADAIHTVSKLEGAFIKSHFKRDPTTIENGVDEYFVRNIWKPEDGRILHSGRIEYYKNIHRLIELIKTMKEGYGLDLKLIIIGEGSYKPTILKTLKRESVTYEIYPFLPRYEYVKQLTRAQLFALISSRESYPQSVNEAHAIGVPTLVAKPWGLNFSGRPRTLTISLEESNHEIAEKLLEFIEKSKHQAKPHVPLWHEVVKDNYMTFYKQVMDAS